jgi:uncharacterized membrane protein HdeD (DUF308 family)
VRFVVPSEDSITPEGFLRRTSDERDGFEVVVASGGRDLPFSSPAEAVRAIDPDDPEGLELAQKAKPVPRLVKKDPLYVAFGGVENALLQAGILNLVAAVVIVALNPDRGDQLARAFAIWVAVASVSAIVGSLGMKRRTAGTRYSFVTTALPTILMGIAGLAIASFLFADPESGRRFFGLVVAAYAMARGTADLWVAAHVGSQTAKPRWLLYAGGVMGIVTTLAILFGPNHGVGIVRLLLALYLGLTGVSLLAYVVAVRRAASGRVRKLVGD